MSVIVSVMGVNTGPISNLEDPICEYIESLLEFQIKTSNIFCNLHNVEILNQIETPRITESEEPLSPSSHEVLELQNSIIELKRQVGSYRERQTELEIERKVMKDLVESTKKTSESEKRQWEIEKDSLSYQIETLKQSKFNLRKEIEKLKFESTMSTSGFYKSPSKSQMKEKRQPSTKKTRKSVSKSSERRGSISKSSERSLRKEKKKAAISVISIRTDRKREPNRLNGGGSVDRSKKTPNGEGRETEPFYHRRGAGMRQSSSPARSNASSRQYGSFSSESITIDDSDGPARSRPMRKDSQGSPPASTTDSLFMKSREREIEEDVLPGSKSNPKPILPNPQNRTRSGTFDRAVAFDEISGEEIAYSDSGGSLSPSFTRDPSVSPIATRSSSRHRRVRTSNTGLLNPFGEPITRDDIKYAFDTFDGKGSGRITYRQFERIARAFGMQCDDSDLRDIFQIVDANKSSCIEYEEFSISVKTLNPRTKPLFDAIMGRANLDNLPSKGSLNPEQIKKMLDGRKAEWTDRVDAMHTLARHCSRKMPSSKFYKIMRTVKMGLLEQLKDGRSMVVRETCIVIAKIAAVQKANFTKYIDQFLKALMELVKMPVAVMSNSGKQATLAITKKVPDNRKLSMLTCILNLGQTSAHKAVRVHCFDLLLIMISDESAKNRSWWKAIQQTLKVGMLDSAVEVRTKAYEATARCEMQEEGSVELLLENLGSSARRRFDKVYDKLKEKRRRGF